MKGLEPKTMGLKKMIRHEYKRIVAFMLTVAMVVTNFGTNLTVAFAAGEETSSLFLLDSSELEDAISTALESGEVFDFSSLELKAKQKSLKTSYEKLIGSKAGKVYQLDVDVDSSYASENTDLQVFYNAGTDSVVFLFINESDMAVTFRANVSGYETARVTVNPNTSNIEDAEGVENAEDYSNTTMVDDEKKAKAEVVKPEGETSETDENGSDETEEETKADVTESENASENGEAEETTGAEKAAETETSEAAETEAETEPETEAEAPAADEAEKEIELTPEEGSASASISAKKVFRVSTSAEAAGEAPAADAEEETEAEEPEKETEAPVETTAEETVADDSTEETIADETQEDETTAADETDGELTDETEAPTEDVTAPDETNGEEPADNGGSENIGFDNDEQFLEDDSIELAGELNGKAYNTVTIWGSANARAYVVKAEDLTGEAAVEGQYSVDYSVDPVGAATIKGAHTVNEGETLYFAVDPQVGYEITEVTANGEDVEEVDAAGVASASNLTKYEHVYAVAEVTEDLEIVATLEEIDGVAHPEFNASYVSSDGVTISLHAEEGILPEGTELEVTEVTAELGDTIKEKMESESEGAAVNTVLAYDINLLYDGNKLDNSWSENGYVDVTFTGAPIQEMSESADTVEIVAVDDTSATKLSAENAAEVEASELKLETVGEQNVEGTAVDEVGFKAEHFTIYAVTGSYYWDADVKLKNMTIYVGDSLIIYTSEAYGDGQWSSSNPDIADVKSTDSYKWRPTATLTAKTAGKTEITCSYYNDYGKLKSDSATITVKDQIVSATKLELPETATVVRNSNITITPTVLEPQNAIITWTTSDSSIATVNANGQVTGVKPGTVTIAAQSGTLTASTTVTVTGIYTYDKTEFYYLKTPTSDKDSNSKDQWGKQLGGSNAFGKIDLTGATFTGKNSYDNVANRVVAWPDGSTGTSYNVVRGSEAWNEIVSYWKGQLSQQLGVDIESADVESIILKPYKISDNERYHVDCTIDINCKKVVTAKYHLLDAGATQFDQVEAKTFKVNTGETQPQKNYPATKTVNNKIYTFVGWYDNEACTGTPVRFPYKVGSTNLDFYAKYVRSDLKYTVNYYEEGTTTKVALSKENKPAGTPGTIIREDAISVPGYTLVSNAQQQIVVKEDGKNEINFYYKKNSYQVSYSYKNEVPNASTLPTSSEHAYKDIVDIAAPATAPGYTFSGWRTDDVVVSNGKFEMPAKNVKLVGEFTANSNTKYTVEHYVENLEGTGYTLRETETDKIGVTGQKATAKAKTYAGFTYDPNVTGTKTEGTILGNGSLVLKLYYRRNSYKVTYEYNNTVAGASTLPAEVSYKYEEDVNVAGVATAPGYTFSGWKTDDATVSNGKFEMPAKNVKLVGGFTANNNTKYTVEHYVENLEGTGYTLRETETDKIGVTGQKATAEAKTYAGFTYDPNVMGTKTEGTILGNGSLVLKLYYRRNSYKVTYEYSNTVAGASTLPAEASYKYGADVNVAGAATAPGYTFNGWKTDDATVLNGKFEMPAKNVKLVGGFTANNNTKYTVEHYVENLEGTGYTLRETETDKIGVTGQKATAKAKTYAGFTYDPNVTGTKTEGTILGNGSLVLKLYYRRNSYKVTYEYNNTVAGASTLPAEASYKYGEDVNVAGVATAPGYTFSGWKTDDATVSNGKFEMPAKNVKLVGEFTANSNTKYTVEHYVENLEGTGYTLRETETDKIGVTGQKATAEAKTYAGFTYDPNVTGTKTEGTILGNGSLVLKLYYRRNSYKVTYEYSNTVAGASTLPAEASYKYGADVNVAGAATAPGYTFNGWKTDDATVSNGKFEMPAKNVKLVGEFTANNNTKYTVEHYVENLEGTGYTLRETETDKIGVTGQKATAKAKTYAGFTYDPNVTGTKTEGTILGNGSLVLKLYYRRNSYKVTYEYSNTVAGASTLPAEASYKYEEDVNVAGAATAPGYTFSGWKTDDATVSNGKFEMPAKNVKLVGEFTANNNTKYTVEHYVENLEGTGYTLRETETDKIGVTGQKATAKAKTYAGFTYDPNVTGTKTEGTILGNGSLVLKLYYRRNSYKVTYEYSNTVAGASTLPAEASYKYGADVNVAGAATAPGYTFSGWKTDDVTVSNGKFEMPANDVILAGGFIKNSYPYFVTYHYEDAKGNEIYADDSVKNVLAEFESVIPYNTTSPKKYAIDGKDHNFVLDKVVFGNTQGAGKTAIVTDVATKNNVDVYYALDELGTNPENPTNPNKPDGIADKYQIVFTYVADDHGTVTGMLKEVVTRYEGDKKFSTTAPAYPIAENIVATPDAGYKFVNWTSKNPSEASANIVAVFSRILQQSSATNAKFKDVAAIRAAGFTQDTEFTAHFVASDATTYNVEVYYEYEGKYSTVPSKTETLAGTTDTKATVAAETYLPTNGYVFDQNAGNVLEGTIAGDNSLVLKVYYKQVFKVTYAPGDHGSFKSQTYTVSYGDQTPEFSGDKTVNGNYRFTGWDKTIESRVTGDIVYTAQWAANSNGGGNGGGGGGSSSGGGGGSSSGPRDNGSTPSGGPGATTVTIDPDAVPLANLPNEDGAADLLVIDDEDVPLAALPKTGQSGASGLVLFLSSMMLAAFVAVSKKREDDK